jgi:hypothetical protein
MRIKGAEIRRHYAVQGPLAFLHVLLRDDRSDFESALRVKVRRDATDYVIEVHGAVALVGGDARGGRAAADLSLE